MRLRDYMIDHDYWKAGTEASNGYVVMESATGRIIARCETLGDARSVAHALRLLERENHERPTGGKRHAENR